PTVVLMVPAMAPLVASMLPRMVSAVMSATMPCGALRIRSPSDPPGWARMNGVIVDETIGWAVVSEPPGPVKTTDWTRVDEPEGARVSAAVTGAGTPAPGFSWANSIFLESNEPPGPVTRNWATWPATLTNTWNVSLAWVTPVPAARGTRASVFAAAS